MLLLFFYYVSCMFKVWQMQTKTCICVRSVCRIAPPKSNVEQRKKRQYGTPPHTINNNTRRSTLSTDDETNNFDLQFFALRKSLKKTRRSIISLRTCIPAETEKKHPMLHWLPRQSHCNIYIYVYMHID